MEIKLQVSRPEREQPGFAPDSPVAWDEHRRRAAALHADLENDPAWQVTDWGDTDDETRTHETVQTVLHWLETVGGPYVALRFGEQALTMVNESVLTGLKRLIGRLAKRQKTQEISSVTILMPQATVQLYPPEQGRPDSVRMFGQTWLDVPINDLTDRRD